MAGMNGMNRKWKMKIKYKKKNGKTWDDDNAVVVDGLSGWANRRSKTFSGGKISL